MPNLGNSRALMMRRRGRGAVAPDPRAKFAVGANLSGAETSQAQWPTSDEMGYFASKGVTTFRLPLSWEGLQPTQAGAMSGAYTAQVSATLAIAAALGCTVLLDVHNYGAYGGVKLGTGGLPVSAFADLWSRLSAFCKADPNYAAIRGYDLMNEWHDMDPNAGTGVDSTAYSRTLIASANQAAINAIRANSDTKTIYVEGDHYSGAWDWVPNNGAWAAALTDPANNLIFSVHCYLDSDSSGTNFVWASEIAKPGYAPPGLATNINIGPQRLAAVTTWAAQNGKRLHVGESGWSNDLLAQGGNDDFAHWNQAGEALLAYCQANKIEFDIWGAGPTFPSSYGYNPEPTSVANPGAKDFTAAGLQSTQMVVLEKYTSYTGPQPTAYRADVPFNATPYAPPGTAIANFKLRYNGKIASSIVFTGHATLADGTDVGGAFTTTTMPAGDNGVLSFSYTPAATYAGIRLSFTNTGGLTNPPAIGCASVSDFFIDQNFVPPNVFGLRRLRTPYVGPAIRLQRDVDAAQQDFYFNNRGDLPRQAIQDWAGGRTIKIVTVYDQSSNRFDLNHVSTSTFATLTLVNADGYPEITHPANAQYTFSSPVDGNTQQSILARVYDVNGGQPFISQDNAGGGSFFPFRFSPSQYKSDSAPTFAVPAGRIANAWHHYAATFKGSTAGGIVTYRDGTQFAQADAPRSGFTDPAGTKTTLGYFSQFTGSQWTGSWQDLIVMQVAATASQVANFASDDAAYYGTALPDSLGAAGTYPVAPAETPFAAPAGTWTPVSGTAAYKGVNIAGGDTGVGSTRPYSYDYFYGTTNEVDYFASKGFGSIRLWTTRGHIQPSSYGALDTTQMGYIKPLLDEAYAKGMRVILDLHDYGGITDTTVSPSVFRSIGADQESINQFVDYWVRLATKFKNYPNVELGLMNEPNKSGVTASMWKAAVAQAITAIRAAGSTHLILIPGVASSAAQAWTSSGNAAAWAGFNGDPANNFMFDIHQYLDQYNTGQSENYTAGGGATRLNSDSCTTWMRSNGFKARLTETGWVADSQTWSGSPPSTEGSAILTYMSSNSDVWAGWNFMAGGCALYYSSYPHGTVVPSGYPSGPFTDKPQMATLTAHL